MAKTVKPIEFEPDAWERFERAANVVAKSPPQHRKAKKPLSTATKDASKPDSAEK